MLCGTDERMTKQLIALAPPTMKIKVIRRELESSDLEPRKQIGLKDFPASYHQGRKVQGVSVEPDVRMKMIQSTMLATLACQRRVVRWTRDQPAHDERSRVAR